MMLQTTICRSSESVKGFRIDQNQQTYVKFHPAPANTGIIFVRKDLPQNPTVSCTLENVRKGFRWSSLAQDDIWVHHTEHILAAIAGTGIDNIITELCSEWIPIVSGGSCADFCHALKNAGIKEYDLPRQVFRLEKPVYYEAPMAETDSRAFKSFPRRYILGIPSESFSVSYIFHVPDADEFRIGLAEYDSAIQNFAEQISSARTYFLEKEAPELSPLLGSVQSDFIIISDKSSQSDVNEVARHKIIDFMGDMMLIGCPLIGRFIAFRSGHSLHHEFLRFLFKKDNYHINKKEKI